MVGCRTLEMAVMYAMRCQGRWYIYSTLHAHQPGVPLEAICFRRRQSRSSTLSASRQFSNQPPNSVQRHTHGSLARVTPRMFLQPLRCISSNEAGL